MFIWDFQVQWDTIDGEDPDQAFGYAVYEGEGDDATTYTNVSEQQLPPSYDLADGETQEGILLYEVPEDRSEFSISFQEYFADDTTGDLFFVFFDL